MGIFAFKLIGEMQFEHWEPSNIAFYQEYACICAQFMIKLTTAMDHFVKIGI